MRDYRHVPDITEVLERLPGAEAFLFDMDGTILDSEVLHAKAFRSLLEGDVPASLKAQNLSETELYRLCLGQTDERVFSILQGYKLFDGRDPKELRIKKNERYLSLLSETEKERLCLPRMAELLLKIREAGHKLALVTSSDKESARASMLRLGLSDLFHLYVTEESTEKNKPDPAPYFLASQSLGVAPENCVVFEDSPAGLEAASNFGAGAVIRACWY